MSYASNELGLIDKNFQHQTLNHRTQGNAAGATCE